MNKPSTNLQREKTAELNIEALKKKKQLVSKSIVLKITHYTYSLFIGARITCVEIVDRKIQTSFT